MRYLYENIVKSSSFGLPRLQPLNPSGFFKKILRKNCFL